MEDKNKLRLLSVSEERLSEEGEIVDKSLEWQLSKNAKGSHFVEKFEFQNFCMKDIIGRVDFKVTIK